MHGVRRVGVVGVVVGLLGVMCVVPVAFSAPTPPLAAGSVLELQVGGVGGVPADAVAVVLNFTVTNPVGTGYVTVYPCGSPRPVASNLNFVAGQSVPNLVIAKLGTSGRVCVYSYAATDLLADVSGYFPVGSGYAPIANPTRILDTRSPVTRLAAGAVLELPVGGVGGVPADAVAAVLNFTVTNPAGTGYVTVYPCGSPRPEASNLNYVAGQSVPNLVIAKLGTAGRVCAYSYAATDLIADVNGFFPAGSSYTPIPNPTRILDTRGSAPCGLLGAVFCETFDKPAGNGSRTGDLSAARWSVSRMVGEPSATNLAPFPSTPVSACRSGVGSVRPDNDLLVCDGPSGHAGQMLSALSAQNYALLSMRPRQQFDFAGRTGTIAYDVDAVTSGILGWWTSLFVTDDPTAGASADQEVNGILPRNGLGLLMNDPCGTADYSKMAVGDAYTYSNYAETRINDANKGCVSTRRGSLNHIEVRLGQSRVEVWASDFSTDGGATFPNFRRIFTATVSLSISRGYVHYQQAERAPLKYGLSPGYTNNYWDNLGFDGPAVNGEVGYSVPDALTTNPNNGATNIGYGLLNNPYSMYTCCNGAPTSVSTLTFGGVDLTNVSRAELSFSVVFVWSVTPTTVVLRYSLNGGPLRTPPQPNYVGEQGGPGGRIGLGVLFNFPVALSDLRAGTNTISFAVDDSPNSWPPILTNLELLTHQ